VALLLPRRQRNDVAYELRALLGEELQSRAAAAGRSTDASLALELLQSFGRPEDVAARYRPTLTIIDPADGIRFRRTCVIGLLVIWCAGLLQHLGESASAAPGVANVLVRWWWGTLIPSLWWPGMLVVAFSAGAWVRRRWPASAPWEPRDEQRIRGGRASLVMAIVGIVIGLLLLLEPRWILDVAFDGKAAPAAYAALTYTDSFLQRQAPWLLALIALNIPLLGAVIAAGRWSLTLRRIELGLALANCAVMLWTVLDGPILLAQAADQTAKFCMAGILIYVLALYAIKLLRRVRPAPGTPLQAVR
jgi:hypothetical protein